METQAAASVGDGCDAHQGLRRISGMGAHVKKTVSRRKERLPHTSDSAPIRGADRKDSRPCGGPAGSAFQETPACVAMATEALVPRGRALISSWNLGSKHQLTTTSISTGRNSPPRTSAFDKPPV